MDIKSAIRVLAKQEIFESILGTVVSVNNSKKTCTVQPLDDQPEILDVRLSAVENPVNGFIAIPAVESFVVVGQTANEQPHVLLFSELDSMSMLFPDAELKFDSAGFKLSVANNDLKEGMSELKAAIGQLKVMTSQGQSSIPINITDINAAFDKVLGTLQ